MKEDRKVLNGDEIKEASGGVNIPRNLTESVSDVPAEVVNMLEAQGFSNEQIKGILSSDQGVNFNTQKEKK